MLPESPASLATPSATLSCFQGHPNWQTQRSKRWTNSVRKHHRLIVYIFRGQKSKTRLQDLKPRSSKVVLSWGAHREIFDLSFPSLWRPNTFKLGPMSPSRRSIFKSVSDSYLVPCLPFLLRKTLWSHEVLWIIHDNLPILISAGQQN